MGIRMIAKLMTTIVFVSLAAGHPRAAHAAAPWWANQIRTMRIRVADCAASAASAIQSVTGAAATTTTLNANTRMIRGFTSSAGIFIHCTAATVTVCGVPRADLTITVFSTLNNAVTLRDQLSAKIGDPILIDCGPVLVPVNDAQSPVSSASSP